MMEGSEINNRDWEIVDEQSSIEKLIVDVFSKEVATVRISESPRPKCKFVSKKPDGNYVLRLDNPVVFPSTQGTIYLNKDRQMELDFEILDHKEDFLLIQPKSIRVARVNRKSERIVDLVGKVTATNFLVSKENIDASKIFGVASSILIQDIHKRLVDHKYQSEVIMANNIRLTEEMKLCFTKAKSIFILDSQKMVSYSDPRVLDIRKEYEEEFLLEDKISAFSKNKISSVLIYPIIIPFGPSKPFAFLTCTKSDGSIEPELLDIYKNVEITFLERIMDSNTHIVDVRQNVINASLHGVALEITDQRIRNALKVKPSLTVDLNFKMQQPLRVALDVRHSEDFGEYDIVGTEIAGFSGDAEGASKYKMFLEFIQKL